MKKPEIKLITLNTPNVGHELDNEAKPYWYYNIYSKDDDLTPLARASNVKSPIGEPWEFDGAINISYENQDEEWAGRYDHMGFSKKNYDEWIKKFNERTKEINENLEMMRKKLDELKSNILNPRNDVKVDKVKTQKVKPIEKEPEYKVMQSPRYF